MKKHFVNLLYKQFCQEQQLSKIFEVEGDPQIFDAVVDNLEIILNIIGHPIDNSHILKTEDEYGTHTINLAQFPEQEPPKRRKRLYEHNINNNFLDPTKEFAIKRSLVKYLHWICKETKKLCKKEGYEVNKNLKKLLKEFKTYKKVWQ